MTLHTDRPNRIMSLPSVQIGTELAVLLADYLDDQEKTRDMTASCVGRPTTGFTIGFLAGEPRQTRKRRPSPWSENSCLSPTARTWPRPWAGRWETTKTS